MTDATPPQSLLGRTFAPVAHVFGGALAAIERRLGPMGTRVALLLFWGGAPGAQNNNRA